MANTVIALKKSATSSAVPSDLANGELAINYADGKLYYKHANGTIAAISSGGDSFGTVNANSTLVVADTSGDVLTLAPGNNISIVGDAVNDKITIGLKDSPTFYGETKVSGGGKFIVDAIGGDEGGEILLEKPPNGNLGGGITIDAYQNKIRIFEQGGSARGVYIDLTSAAGGVGTDLLNPSATPDTTARDWAASAFAKANTANTTADFAYVQANTARTHANASFDQANTARTQANTATTDAGNAFGQANTARTHANTAHLTANAAFDQANTARTHANSAFGQANTATTDAGNAFTQANTARTHANAAHLTANSAFDKANAALPLTGGTITGSLQIAGNLSVSGNTTFVNAENLKVSDPLIYLAGNNYVSDIVDIGFIANYVNSTGSNVHTGLYREHEDKMYYLFYGYDVEPANNHIGALSNNMVLAVLNADLRTSNLTLGGVNAITWITSSYNQANTARDHANSAFGQANTATTNAGNSFGQANTARTHANNAYAQANAAFEKANTSSGGSAYYSGNNGDVGTATGLGDIFRVHTNTLTANTTIYSGNNALAAGPITVAANRTLTIQANARVAIV